MAFEHLVWCLSIQGLIRGSSMQIVRNVDGLDPEVHWGLRIEHHSPGLLGQDSDHPFRDVVLVLCIWRTWLECNTLDGKDSSERFVVVFSTSIVRAKPLDIISPAIHFGLKSLEGCHEGLRTFVREDSDLHMMRVVIDEDNKVLNTA